MQHANERDMVAHMSEHRLGIFSDADRGVYGLPSFDELRAWWGTEAERLDRIDHAADILDQAAERRNDRLAVEKLPLVEKYIKGNLGIPVAQEDRCIRRQALC